MNCNVDLTRVKAPLLFEASKEISWSNPKLYIKDDLRTLVFTGCYKKGEEVKSCRVVSRSRDLISWTVPVPLESECRPEGEEGKDVRASESWSRFSWASAGVCSANALWDPQLHMYLAVYQGNRPVNGTDDETEGSIGIAVSRDLTHWQSFLKDHPTYPGHGVIYEGDYYPAIPFSEYIHPEELPAGEKVFDVRDFGAVSDGETLSTEAVQAAVDAAATCGGTVLVSGRILLCGRCSSCVWDNALDPFRQRSLRFT